MSPFLFALALLLSQTSEPAPGPDNLHTLQKKIAEREARRPALERKIREAVDRGDDEVARGLSQEFKENEREIEGLTKRVAELKAAREPRWIDNVKVSGQALLTGWDPALGLADGFGWGTSITLGKTLSFEYQRWETHSTVSGAPVTVQSFELGLEREAGHAVEGALTFSLRSGIGLARFSSAGMRSDTGLVLSLRPEWRYYFNPLSSVGLGGDFDFFWTHFNGSSTRGRQASSFLCSIELAF